MPVLIEELNHFLDRYGLDFFQKKAPAYILENLRPEMGKRAYQQEAFGRFVHYFEEMWPEDTPQQLLFHMATGSGKTLVMAGLMLYLYEKGYRNFLFFVNSTQIIEKTKDNFLNPRSAKYLFAPALSMGDRSFRIREAAQFQATDAHDLHVVFSTIQGLHSRLQSPQENGLSYDDFEGQPLVMISDEAHHLNAETKKGNRLSAEEQSELSSWEGTVTRIFGAHPRNILLEFTATADLSAPAIAEKYRDKLLFDYPLRQFRQDGYSKEVKVLQADLPPFERALHAVLLSQYRRKLFEKYGQPIKPVLLFKSKTIKDSHAFFEEFTQKMQRLTAADLQKAHFRTPDLQQAFQYFEAHRISPAQLAMELKRDFSEEKLISVNSKDETEEKQLAINSLEDENNPYRAVFAVDKLNEGWDVLNLFDIVRLYDTRDAKAGKPGKTTLAEAQLIGRGARYCPFQLSASQPPDRRKFDNDLENELRVGETLYYHSAYNPPYIQELNHALTEIGIQEKNAREKRLILKDAFKHSEVFRSGVLLLNRREKHTREGVAGLPAQWIEKPVPVRLKTGRTAVSDAFDRAEMTAVATHRARLRLMDLGEPIIRKAIRQLPFFQFDHLKKYLPQLRSISEFMYSENYLGNITLDIAASPEQSGQLSPADRLGAAVQVLENIAQSLASEQVKYIGSALFEPFPLSQLLKDRTVRVRQSGEGGKSTKSQHDFLDLSQQNWFIYQDFWGTDSQHDFIEFIYEKINTFNTLYNSIYLIPNLQDFRWYDQENGQAFTPDFVLYEVRQQQGREVHHQWWVRAGEGPFVEFWEAFQREQAHPLPEGVRYVAWQWPHLAKVAYGELGNGCMGVFPALVSS